MPIRPKFTKTQERILRRLEEVQPGEADARNLFAGRAAAPALFALAGRGLVMLRQTRDVGYHAWLTPAGVEEVRSLPDW